MIVGSIKEDITSEKRVSVTPESAKNIIGLGLKVFIEKGYALHLGINDNDYKDIGAEIMETSKEVLNSSNLLTKVNCPSEDEIKINGTLFNEHAVTTFSAPKTFIWKLLLGLVADAGFARQARLIAASKFFTLSISIFSFCDRHRAKFFSLSVLMMFICGLPTNLATKRDFGLL